MTKYKNNISTESREERKINKQKENGKPCRDHSHRTSCLGYDQSTKLEEAPQHHTHRSEPEAPSSSANSETHHPFHQNL
jgi:hypothetical protein